MNDMMRTLFELQTIEFEDTIRPENEKRIEKLRAGIPAPILGHYDRLADRGKKGVAVLHDQVCTGCHMRVPLAVVMNLMKGLDVTLCENCGRYLCLPEPVETKTEPEIPKPEVKTAKRKKAGKLRPVAHGH